MQRDTVRLRNALEDAMGLQLLTVGPLLAGACALGPWLIPILFGHQWKAAVPFLPLLAISALLSNGFLALISVLTVRNKIAAVVRVNLANFVVLFSVSAILVPHIGINGYGVGEVSATLATALVAHIETRRLLSFSYRSALPWFAAAAPVMAAPWIPLTWRAVVFVPALMALMLRHTRRELVRQERMARNALLRRSPATEEEEGVILPGEDEPALALEPTPPEPL